MTVDSTAWPTEPRVPDRLLDDLARQMRRACAERQLSGEQHAPPELALAMVEPRQLVADDCSID